jgi:hypothetical protein
MVSFHVLPDHSAARTAVIWLTDIPGDLNWLSVEQRPDLNDFQPQVID